MREEKLNKLLQLLNFSLKNKILLRDLLKLEKKRLGFDENALVFISAGDLSKFYWCPMQTYFSLREHEEDKFLCYLQDRIEYSIKLTKISIIPKNEEEILKIGENLSLNNIFTLLEQREFQNQVKQSQIDIAKEELKICKTPQERGHLLETIYAKKYPQIHWVKKYDEFIFTCEPDGITETQVYEFKSSKNEYFAKEALKKARLQADIYGICFKKEEKVIDQYIISNNKIYTYIEKVRTNEIDFVINEIKKIINDNLPKKPKEEFKCRNCKYKDICRIKN